MNKFFALLITGLFCGCVCDQPPEILHPVIEPGGHGVFIANEGNFLFGNAQVSYYDPVSQSVAQDIFEPANDRPLGDICQSLTFFQARIFIVVNNSGKIEVINEDDFTSADVIHGFTSPRFMLPVSNSKAYVSDLYQNAVTIVNLSENAVQGSIAIPGWTEEMHLLYGKVFITNQLGDHVIVVDTEMDAIIDSIPVTWGGNSLVEDKYGKLWVLCSGNTSLGIPAGLFRIDPLTHAVEKSFMFSTPGAPWRLDINSAGEYLYFLNGDLFRMSVNDTELAEEPWIEKTIGVFHGLGIDPFTDEIYVSDALDYVQRGQVLRFTADGIPVDTFLAGIIPGEFYFR